MRYERVKYRPLQRDGSDFHIEQAKSIVPWKSIIFATILTSVGFSLLVFGISIIGGYTDIKYGDRMWPVLILGSLMFLPGAYHVRIAYMAYFGRQGYSFDQIPEFY